MFDFTLPVNNCIHFWQVEFNDEQRNNFQPNKELNCYNPKNWLQNSFLLIFSNSDLILPVCKHDLKATEMGKPVDDFNSYRSKMNKKILASGNKTMKRIYSLDTLTYQKGALSTKTKEMLGLATSMVLRCDDCVKYHLEKCHEQGVTTDEIFEVFGVANLVGGTIVIPHTRRAVEYWEELTATTF